MILIRTNIRIYSYQENDTNEYPNIFVSRKLIRTNVRINIRIENIRIFEYSNIFVTLCYDANNDANDNYDGDNNNGDENDNEDYDVHCNIATCAM